MSESKFIAYVGPRDIHDATVQSVVQDGDTVTIRLVTMVRATICLEFHGVFELVSTNAVGMMLYALAEISGTEPLRRYTFASWDEDYPGTLEVIAEGFQVAT